METNNFSGINQSKDDAVLHQRTNRKDGRILCGSPIIVGEGTVFDPSTGSFGGLNI